ncbi:Transposon Tf2-9 polyprotein [Glycine soja]|uniref:Transposon Tf2-9 polyprotein n=1 Tax=Glycine soja TaxID=3848 RepID=A0A445F0W6_GLYSO|nr:Transposon Tf2-9 polyprotein [Glycine soja]
MSHNAPSSFQATMNSLFQPYLRRFVIIFFDDILIYSASIEEHLTDLEVAFQVLLNHQFVLKLSKCFFAQSQVEYLGHLVSHAGVQPVASKIDAIRQWPVPQTIRAVRSFLGLAGYASIAAPLVQLTTMPKFQWTVTAQIAFDHLKWALSEASVLALPDFTLPFTLETDALEYLLGHRFLIITDHRSLKELLTQAIQTPEQHTYLARLMGYDYQIIYRSGTHNQVADALSRLPETASSSMMTLSVPCLTFISELHQQLEAHPAYVAHHKAIREYPSAHPHFTITNDLVLHKKRIWLPREFAMIPTLLTEYHCTPTGGHMGIAKTLARVTENFHWPGIREDVIRHVSQCLNCQQTKYETKKSASLLCPLPVPYRPWEDLSLDFITGLPSYHGNTVILVVVDRFSKGIHLGMLPTSHTAHTVATLFMEIVGKIHGLPRSLVSDRDPLFTEVMNRVVEQYLRAFVNGKPKTWGKLLLWVEWSHNTSWNAATGATPYEITFGRQPFNFPDYLTGSSKLDAVEDMLTNRDETFKVIRKKLLKAQATMKKVADTKRREEEYQIGDWVLVKLRPRRQFLAKDLTDTRGKLAKRFFGPFKVVERIGPVTYRLQLPDTARIHPFFHYSLLKRFQGNPEFPNIEHLLQVLGRCWCNETSWEDWESLRQEYHLEDKVILQGPPDDSSSNTGDIISSKDEDVTVATTGVHQANKEYFNFCTYHGWFPKLRCLRILSLSKYKNITELPDSIGNLLHLWYLDLSYTSIESLSYETFMLYNLQTLILSNCEFLIQLPQPIGNLVNLRHLDISYTNFPEMATQLCRLQDLRTLTVFIVGKQDGLSIRDLRKFPYLLGKLSILNLQNVVNPVDAFRANLKNKEQIEELMLEWGSNPQDPQIEKDVLNNLQPSTNLKKLNIKYYGGTSFPNWIGHSSFSNIIVLNVSQ